MGKIKKYNQFIKESISLRLDHKGNPRCSAFDGDIKHGEVEYDEIDNLKPSTIDEFIEEIRRCIEVNHEITSTDLSIRVDSEIKKIFGDNYSKYYYEPIDLDKDSEKFSFHYDDLSLAIAMLINLGYSIGYLSRKYSLKGWNFSKFFGYDGEVFTSEKDFKKISSDKLNYNGPDITHSSLLATSLNIKNSLSRSNIRFSEEDQGITEISILFSRPFAYGYDSGAKMVDKEEDLYYSKIGTNKDRYYDLLMNRERTPDEQKEFNDIKRREDIMNYGEDYVKDLEKARAEFDALPKEEQERRRKENAAKLSKMMDDLFKDL